MEPAMQDDSPVLKEQVARALIALGLIHQQEDRAAQAHACFEEVVR